MGTGQYFDLKSNSWPFIWKKPKYWLFQTSQVIVFVALFDEDMNRNGIDDQNKDNIFNGTLDILEEDDDNDNNEVVNIYYLLC